MIDCRRVSLLSPGSLTPAARRDHITDLPRSATRGYSTADVPAIRGPQKKSEIFT